MCLCRSIVAIGASGVALSWAPGYKADKSQSTAPNDWPRRAVPVRRGTISTSLAEPRLEDRTACAPCPRTNTRHHAVYELARGCTVQSTMSTYEMQGQADHEHRSMRDNTRTRSTESMACSSWTAGGENFSSVATVHSHRTMQTSDGDKRLRTPSSCCLLFRPTNCDSCSSSGSRHSCRRTV